MAKYICIRVYLLNITFPKEKKIKNREELDPGIPVLETRIAEEKDGVIKIEHYIKTPIAKYVCVPEDKWREYIKRARRELTKMRYWRNPGYYVHTKAVELVIKDFYGREVSVTNEYKVSRQ